MYPEDSLRSAALFERARKVMPGGNSRHGVFLSPFPPYAVSGSGCRVIDADGVERIDCVNNWSSLIHGHCNPAIVEAVRHQAGILMAAGMPTEAEIELAELLVDRLPGIEQLRFSNSGSEGVLFALRAARAFTGRDRIAKVEGAYHGSIDAVEVSVAPSSTRWGSAWAPASVPATEGIPQSVLTIRWSCPSTMCRPPKRCCGNRDRRWQPWCLTRWCHAWGWSRRRLNTCG